MLRRYQQLLFLVVSTIAVFMIATPSSSIGQTQPATPYQEKKDEFNYNTLTIMTGGIKGTYAVFGQDIQNVLEQGKQPNGLRILPVSSNGAVQNTRDLLFLRGIDMALTQQEALEYYKNEDATLYGSIYDRIRYIVKLYNSEIHLLVSNDIKTVADLEGKKVNLYHKESATDISLPIIFKICGVNIEPTYFDLEDSIVKVKNGEISGAAFIAGAPIAAYNQQVKAGDNVHFMSFDAQTVPSGAFSKLLKIYLPAQLAHEAYPKIIPEGKRVTTLASGVVLATYNWPEAGDRYRRVSAFVNAFFSKFDEFLKEPRHPKWKETNLAAEVPGWTRFKAASQWLAEHKSASEADTKAAFEQFLAARPAAAGNVSQDRKQQLFKEFLEWRQSEKQNLTTR